MPLTVLFNNRQNSAPDGTTRDKVTTTTVTAKKQGVRTRNPPPANNPNNNKNNYRGSSSRSNTTTNRKNNYDNNSQQEQQQRRLNQQVVQCETAKDLLLLLASHKGALTAPAGGGVFNSVNFSTSLHRIARHLTNYNSQQQQKSTNQQQQGQADSRYHRAVILSDPRFALFLCSLAEALGGVRYSTTSTTPTASASSSSSSKIVSFGSREMSNIVWALAKMKIAPPQSASPLLTPYNHHTMLLETAQQVRTQVLQVAKEKVQLQKQQQQAGGGGDDSPQQSWIPTLSLLCGHIMDTIALRISAASATTGHNQKENAYNNNNQNNQNNMNKNDNAFQERANLLWALATAQRASDVVFDTVITKMVEDMELQQQQQQQQQSLNDTDDTTTTTTTNPRRQKGRHQRSDELQPQEWSNSIWAFATAQIYGTTGQVRLFQFVATALDTQKEAFRDRFKPQELSNTAWGVASLLSKQQKSNSSSSSSTNNNTTNKEEQDAAVTILRHVATAVIERAAEFKPQELSNTLWAFATLGFGMGGAAAAAAASSKNYGPAALNDYVILPSNDPEGDQQLLLRATNAALESALPRIHRFRSQELNNVAWALARMDRRDATTYLEAIGRQLCDPRRKVTPQDIGTTLWSLATLECIVNEDIFRGIASRLTVDRAASFKPQELSNTLWALATAELSPKYPDVYDTVLIAPEQRFTGPLNAIDDPITLCFGAAAQELMRRPFDFKSQEIKDILWSFSKIGIRHPDLFKATAIHLVGSDTNNRKGKQERVRGVDDFSPQGLGNMAWAFARQAQLVADVNERTDIAAKITSNAGRMAAYVTSFFDIGEILIQRLFKAIAEADLRVHDNLSKLTPQDLSNTAWAMAVLGMRHTPFLKAAEQQFVERTMQYVQGRDTSMTFFKGQEMANLLWAFAIVNTPIRNLEATVAPYVIQSTVGSARAINAASIARMYKRQELANIAWSCAVFGDYPHNLMKLLYCGLVGIGNKRDPAHLIKCYRDGGLQREAIMSLIYLQLAMEMEGKENGLSLPENFPEGWSRQSLPRTTSGFTETTFELNLSTSKLQRDVSAAFRRIGFDHVEEHVITVDELLDNQGVSLSSNPINVISIDIANVEARVCVEVDGPAHYVADIEAVPPKGGYQKVVNGRLEYQFNMNGDRHSVNGPTVLKKRILEQMGWKTINIPFWEWYDLNGDGAAEDAYCRRLLADNNR